LQQAYRLIKDGNKTQATSILVPIVRAEPNNADAWWLLANAVSNTEQQRRSLEQVLRLRPNDEKARRMLDRIGGGASAPPPPPPQPAPPPDPFAASTSYPPQQTYDPFAGSTSEPDPFAGDPFDTSDPFADVIDQRRERRDVTPVGAAPPVIVQRRKGTSPFVIFLAIIGVIGIIGCAICAIATGGFAFLGGQFIQQVAGTLTSDPDFATAMQEFGNLGLTLTADPNFGGLAATMSSSLEEIGGAAVLGDYNRRGAVEMGQTVTGTVDTFDDDGWTFEGSDGDEITVELVATDNDLDPQLYVYGPDEGLIAENDDIDFANDNRNSRVEVTLPSSGTYTIIVSAFGEGGAYELSVR
jgi:hypothetical protein